MTLAAPQELGRRNCLHIIFLSQESFELSEIRHPCMEIQSVARPAAEHREGCRLRGRSQEPAVRTGMSPRAARLQGTGPIVSNCGTSRWYAARDGIFAARELTWCVESIRGAQERAPQQSELFCRFRRLSARCTGAADPGAAASAFPGLDRVVDRLPCRHRGVDLAGIRHPSLGVAPDPVLCCDA